jgi:hypothetical protein
LLPISALPILKEKAMAQHRPAPAQTDAVEGLNETESILATLDALLQTVSSPIVRVCLEEARDDIAHLSSTEEPWDLEQRAAA